MLTFFTTPKPFRGHEAVIQRNALQSWKMLHPDVEVILFGDDDGAAEICAELGLRHEPRVERHESGAKQLDYIFRRATQIAKHDHLCFSNCDIILMNDFWNAFQTARSWKNSFLAVGRRWDIDITQPIGFDDSDWQGQLKESVRAKAFRQTQHWIDFFLFTKGRYLDMPPLIVGHAYWDGWMIWKALSDRVAVLDVSYCVVAVHQNHGYSPKFGRIKGVSTDPLSMLNRELVGGMGHLATINQANYRSTQAGISRNWFFWLDPMERQLGPVLHKTGVSKCYYAFQTYLWHPILNLTRPLRHAVGLRQRTRPTRINE